MNMKKSGKWIIIIVVLALIGFFFIGNDSIITLYSSFRDWKKSERNVKKAHVEIDSLQAEIKKLKNDTAHIEKIAREKLGMAGKNENVYKFIEEK